jgi:hypothetical protein
MRLRGVRAEEESAGNILCKRKISIFRLCGDVEWREVGTARGGRLTY